MLSHRLYGIVQVVVIATAVLLSSTVASADSKSSDNETPPPRAGWSVAGSAATTALETAKAVNGGSAITAVKNDPSSGGTLGDPDPCQYTLITDPASPSWKGRSPADGYLVNVSCPVSVEDASSRTAGRLVYEDQGVVFVPHGQAPQPPPPNPDVLAQRVVDTIVVPAPQLNIGPVSGDVLVNRPLWLWVANAAPISRSVSLRGVTVTVEVKVASTEWSLGEPADKPGTAGEATVSCEGTGSPAPELASLPLDTKLWEPECGYAYRWRSTPERTDGAGTWTLSARTVWNVTWTSNIGASGTATLTSQPSSQAVRVVEQRAVLVHDPNSNDGGN